MASTESRPVEVDTLSALTPESQAMLDELVEQSHWNQTAQDWAIFSRLGSVHVVRDEHKRIIASGAVLPLGDNAAWISLILVTPPRRGQGLGRAVFEHCLKEVQASGRTAMLDATPDGERLYRQYSFEALWRLTRWHRAGVDGAQAGARPHAPIALEAIATLDAQALGFARHVLLADLMAREDTDVVRHAEAMAIVRAGRVARHIGPLLASNEQAAAQLLGDIAGATAEALFIDVPDDRPLMRQALSAAGFTPQRGFARMALGDAAPHGMTAFMHAIAGPEFG
ncbi:GNAT family N-acetyltransferase [Pusillimonas noertemannii]|uniref:GNAT family N-acetyltransferase n=2 Tax=Pusillimonas noertemannii TaxID=305977 RepID=UPI0002EFEC66|nr:GNAT family N-acetyltransferase [Pusillimonas noertemannii]